MAGNGTSGNGGTRTRPLTASEKSKRAVAAAKKRRAVAAKKKANK